ncbi:MAG: hypothetical protein WC584_04000 [Candidatus Pacearchaeota archaeon]
MEKRGDLSVLSVSGRGIPEAWENSLIKLNNEGLWYERAGRKDKGRLQVDSTMTVEIIEPIKYSFMHSFGGYGWEQIFEYQMEMLGAKDSFEDRKGESNKWPYQYHERLADYPGTTMNINQIEEGIIRKLSQRLDTRQANAITWVPERDNYSIDPPCLQRIWCGLVSLDNPEKGPFALNMNYNFRSRNAMIAAPWNMVGLLTIQSYIINRLKEETGKEIKHARLVDFTDAYHVRADDQPKLENFIGQLTDSKKRREEIEQRVFPREMVLEMMNDSRNSVEKKIISQAENYFQGEKLERKIGEIEEIAKIVVDINKTYLES